MVRANATLFKGAYYQADRAKYGWMAAARKFGTVADQAAFAISASRCRCRSIGTFRGA